jgi:endonuclease III related protein
MTTAERLLIMYDRMFGQLGPQHWWPAETPFEVMVGAILTQNTSWKNVERAITNLKGVGLMSLERCQPCPPVFGRVYPAGRLL